jgi:hypothetical protein
VLLQVRRSWPVLLVLVLLAVWPLRASLLGGDIPGAGPDVLSTLWGMWWFGQEWLGAAWGGWTPLANYPSGAWGAVLSPLSGIVYSLTEPLVGIGRAAAAADWVQAAGLAVATALLARRLGCSMAGALAAGLVPLGMRYTWYGLGEGSVVAIAALFVPMGLFYLIETLEAPCTKSAACAAACMALVALENPYLAPVLPTVALAQVLWTLRRGLRKGPWRDPNRRTAAFLAAALTAGSAGILGVSALYGRVASPDYPPRIVVETRQLGPWLFEVIDKPWARLDPVDMFRPNQVRWTLDVFAGEGAQGGDYLGLAALALALSSAFLVGRRAWPWLVVGLGSVMLALGSVSGIVPLPFLVLNDIMDAVARPLTQPTRFLCVAGVGLGVAAGLAVDALARLPIPHARWGAVAVLALDGLLLGGLGMALPLTQVPDAPCVRDLRGEEGAVLVWPGDASFWEGDLPRIWLFQLLHELPSANPGIASWALHGGRSRDALKTQGGFAYRSFEGTHMGEPTGTPQISWLADQGFRWLVVDVERDPGQLAWARRHFGPPVAECGIAVVHRIDPTASK